MVIEKYPHNRLPFMMAWYLPNFKWVKFQGWNFDCEKLASMHLVPSIINSLP